MSTSPPLRPHASAVLTFVLALCASTGAAGCADSGERDAEVTIEWTVDPEPARVGSTLVAAALANPSGQPVERADVVIEGMMTHPGMQPELAAAREVSPGRYEAALDLTMAGDWILLLKATLPDGTTIRRQHELPRVRAQ